MPVWPDSTGFRLLRTQSLENGDPSNVSRLDCDVHTGTHIDAPRHFLKNGATVEQLPLDTLIGPAIVAYLPNVTEIAASDMAALSLPDGTKRLLLKTSNSALWAKQQGFDTGFVGLTADAAKWIVERGISLVGVDYLSVQKYGDGPETHLILLGAEVVILEGIDLSGAEAGQYELICLPLKITGAEGAPARAVLRQMPIGQNRQPASGGQK
jgi:arylformamidase